MNKRQVEFRGSGNEYARIFYSNLALTILTLGLYGPWAKVRKQKYLLQNTYLEDSNFNYTADPKKILIGRLLVIAAFTLLSVVSGFSPILYGILLLALIGFVPYLIVKGLRFKAKYTTYRGIPFKHHATKGGVFVKTMLMKIVSYISLMILHPRVKYEERKYLLNNLSFGTKKFVFNGTISEFYKVYLKTSAISIVLGLCIFGLVFLIGGLFVAATAGVFMAYLLIMLTLYLYSFGIKKATLDNARLHTYAVTIEMTFAEYTALVVKNLLLMIVTAGIAIPWATINIKREFLSNIFITGEDQADQFIGEERAEVAALGGEFLDFESGFDFEFGF